MPFSFLCSTLLFGLFLRLPVNTLWNCFTCQVPITSLLATLVWWDAWRTHRTQHITVLIAMIYSSKSIQSRRAKRKVYRAKSGGKAGTNFQSPLPIESHRMCLIPPATELCHVWKVVYHKTSLKMQCQKQTNKQKQKMPRQGTPAQWLGLHAFTANSPGSIPVWRTEIPQATQQGQINTKQTSCARVVIVGYSHRYILPSIDPNSRFPGRKHVLTQTTLYKHLSHRKQL